MLEQEVRDVIIKSLNIKPEEVKIDQKLYDSLGVDSTEIVDLRVSLEKRFGIKLEAKEISKFSSPKEIINLIERKKNQG